jgi:hypothetical protein
VWKVLKIQVQKRLKRNKECRWLETCCSGYLDRFGFALHTEFIWQYTSTDQVCFKKQGSDNKILEVRKLRLLHEMLL